jgi:hypothetical protein
MEEKMKLKILPLALVMLILIQACGSPNPQPAEPPYTMPIITPSPSLPDFSSHLYFAFGGGGDGDCDPVVEIGYFSQRGGTLCVYDLPLGIVFHISLISPDGKTSLEGDFKVMDSSDGPQVIWVGHEMEEHYAEIRSLDSEHNTAIVRYGLWWAGGLPTGEWEARVSWDGHETNDILNVHASQEPEIYFVDPRSGKDIFLSSTPYHTCHRTNDSQNISIGGNNFPPSGLIYLLVYQKTPENGWLTEKVAQQAVVTNSTGKFEAALAEALSPGEYVVIAGTSSDFVDSNIEESMLDPEKIGNAIDCFIVP